MYLDHAATTPLRPSARLAMEPFLSDSFGNPSGVHHEARRAKDAMEDARARIAALLGVKPLEVVFTGGGTESDNLGVAGPALAGGSRGGVVVSAIEHDAVLETASFLGRLGCAVEVVGVDSLGVVDPDAVLDAVDRETAVVSVMAANNETGARQPIETISARLRSEFPTVVIHTDAVQAGVSEDVSGLGAHLVTLASHKLGGPKGVGLLTVPEGIDLEAVIHGGGQELGRRSGTHDVAGIVGMAAALEESVADRSRFRTEVGQARNLFESTLQERLGDLEVNGPIRDRLVQHSHLRFPGVDAETLLIRLDGNGLEAAAGSACHSGAIEVSHVLEAMGMDAEKAGECVRFSFGWNSTVAEAEKAAGVVADTVEALR